MKTFWLTLAAVGALLLTGCGYWGTYGTMHGRGLMPYGFGGGFMGLILIVFVAVILYLLLRGGPEKAARGNANETPLQILEKRYARGEITREQFEDMKKDLSI